MKTPFISVVYQKHLINAAILRLNDHLYTTRFRTGLLFIITFSVHEDESNVTNTQVNMVFLLWSNHRPQSMTFNLLQINFLIWHMFPLVTLFFSICICKYCHIP